MEQKCFESNLKKNVEITISEPEVPVKIIEDTERDIKRAAVQLGKIKESLITARGHQSTMEVAEDVGKACVVLWDMREIE